MDLRCPSLDSRVILYPIIADYAGLGLVVLPGFGLMNLEDAWRF